MKHLFLIFSVLLSLNAWAQVPNLKGCYRNDLNQFYEFHRDTFTYTGVYGHVLKAGKGKYTINDDTIYFNYFTDTVKYYSTHISIDTSVKSDSILLKVMDSEKSEPLAGVMISYDTISSPMVTDSTGEIRLPEYHFPVRLILIGCQPITLTQADLADGNKALIKINLNECRPRITGSEKFRVKLYSGAMDINGVFYKYDSKGCSINK